VDQGAERDVVAQAGPSLYVDAVAECHAVSEACSGGNGDPPTGCEFGADERILGAFSRVSEAQGYVAP
jgi:hypothetical protein